MKRVLKNYSKTKLKTVFRGRKIDFLGKHTKTFDMSKEEELAEYRHWRNLWDFLIDISERRDIKEMLAKGVKGKNEKKDSS